MAATTGSLINSCYCPWCSKWKFSLSLRFKERRNINNRICKTLLILFLLLSGSFITFPVVSSLSVKKEDILELKQADIITNTSGGISIRHPGQNLSLDPETDCLEGSRPECSCTSSWKCRRCSRFELSKKLQYCLYTGYRRFAYCPNSKTKHKKKYISCQYVNSKEDAHFWLFEGAVVCLGFLSYFVVRLRTNTLQQRFTRRIQRQLNA